MRKIFRAFNSYRGQQIWLTLLLIFPFVLWILPGDFFDGDNFVVCPSRLIFGLECLGCGLTRSILHMHHFQFDDAIYYNMLGLIVYPLLIILWLYWIIRAFNRINKSGSYF